MSVALVRRILARLEAAELKETNPHFQDDYRIAWVTVLCAGDRRAHPHPHVEASYRVLGLHPDKVWPAIQARRRAKLGKEYDKFYSSTGGLLPIDRSSPKKPVQSERRTRKRTDDEGAA
jgi:hypothetical protein